MRCYRKKHSLNFREGDHLPFRGNHRARVTRLRSVNQALELRPPIAGWVRDPERNLVDMAKQTTFASFRADTDTSTTSWGTITSSKMGRSEAHTKTIFYLRKGFYIRILQLHRYFLRLDRSDTNYKYIVCGSHFPPPFRPFASPSCPPSLGFYSVFSPFSFSALPLPLTFLVVIIFPVSSSPALAMLPERSPAGHAVLLHPL